MKVSLLYQCQTRSIHFALASIARLFGYAALDEDWAELARLPRTE